MITAWTERGSHKNSFSREILETTLLYVMLCNITKQPCSFIDPLLNAYLPMESKLPVLTEAANYSCIAEAQKKFSDLYCDCPVPCQDEFYDRHTSQSAWPSHITGRYMLERLKITNPARYSNISMDFVTRNFLSSKYIYLIFRLLRLFKSQRMIGVILYQILVGIWAYGLVPFMFSLFELGSFILRLIMSKFHSAKKKSGLREKAQ